MRLKVTLIMTAILLGVSLLVGMLISGSMKNNTAEMSLPSDDAATAYITEHSLLNTITEVKTIRAAGPVFKMVSGTDAAGEEKTIYLAGKGKAIKVYGTASPDEGATREQILEQLELRGINEDQIKEMFVTPYDYTSGHMVWYILNHGEKKHVLWYNFDSGKFIREAYQDPTAWNLRG